MANQIDDIGIVMDMDSQGVLWKKNFSMMLQGFDDYNFATIENALHLINNDVVDVFAESKNHARWVV